MYSSSEANTGTISGYPTHVLFLCYLEETIHINDIVDKHGAEVVAVDALLQAIRHHVLRNPYHRTTMPPTRTHVHTHRTCTMSAVVLHHVHCDRSSWSLFFMITTVRARQTLWPHASSRQTMHSNSIAELHNK